MTFRHESGESLGNLRIAPSLGIAPSLEDAVVAICMPLSDKEGFLCKPETEWEGMDVGMKMQ